MRDDAALLAALARHGVPFVIVGGHAVNFHGYGRATEDTDLLWLRSPESEQALASALNEIGACYISDQIDPATGVERTVPVTLPFIRATRLMMLWTNHGFLDLFDYVPGLPDEQVADVLKSASEAGGVRYASLPFLRRMKLAAGRSKDKVDLENLPG